MKFCPNCGTELADDDKTCYKCGAQVKVLHEEEVVLEEVTSEEMVEGLNEIENKPVAKDDKISIWLCGLACLFPIVGIVYYFMKREEYPIKSRWALWSGIIAWGIMLMVNFYTIV